MANNFKLTIEYDGTHYHGWQRQPNGPTIQEAIETALKTITRQNITLIGSGRTDAGVHAQGQTANFICETRLGPDTLLKGLNSLLANDIVIRQCQIVAPQFHARYDVKSKIYRYVIRNHPLPAAIGRQYAWWIRTPLNLEAMQRAADRFVGEHDFKAFEASGSPRSHTQRQVMSAQWKHHLEHLLSFDIQANGFLRYMVRNIVGTLVAVGLNKIPSHAVETLLESRDRCKAPPTAPPHGLCLVDVLYE